MRAPRQFRCVGCRRWFKSRREPAGCPTCGSGNIREVKPAAVSSRSAKKYGSTAEELAYLDLDAAAELGEAQVKEAAWREGREPTLAELDAGAESGVAQAKERARG